jgi:hypothetical protein
MRTGRIVIAAFSTLFFIFTAILTIPACVYAGWIYEGEWGGFGTGNGQFNGAGFVDVADNGNVYVTDLLNHRV